MAIPPRKADHAPTQAEITDLLQILVFRKTITRDQAERVRRYARANSMPVMQTIVQLGIASEIQITEALAAFAGLRFVRINPLELDLDVVTGALSGPFARKHGLVAIAKDDQKLTVAVHDPFAPFPIDDIKRVTGLRAIERVIAARLGIDGMLPDVNVIPKIDYQALISRVKLLSGCNIAEKRRPQDGRIKRDQNGREIELRVSTMPTAFGEKGVLRIFDPDILLKSVDELGFAAPDLAKFHQFLTRSHGIILVTGPTGSGKTTTLYSVLKHLSRPEVNIVTIEDPIEMVHEEFNQVAVRPAIELTFGNALRTVLRQDPDIIMVGEIRDGETAANAVQAALTGHLVLSTLHTNDAPSTVT